MHFWTDKNQQKKACWLARAALAFNRQPSKDRGLFLIVPCYLDSVVYFACMFCLINLCSGHLNSQGKSLGDLDIYPGISRFFPLKPGVKG